MNEIDVCKNTLVFLERVTVQGPQEAAYLLNCVEHFSTKISALEKPPETADKDDKKGK